ncbi:MAG: sodium/hydrogen antiporter [Chloroflexota bacterium]|nr:sodium/hydrogen antiporter [Chloroflexota bacterium]
MISLLGIIAVAIIGYALISKRLSTTVVTAPIFFAGVGLLMGPVLGLLETEQDPEVPTLLLEAALVMVLFADASSLDVRRWTREAGLAGRLLGLGLPLTMLAGAVAALLLVPGMEIWEAALIGVILAPTDAALGQAVVANPRVPAVIRNALNVESGLNDGLALPFVTIFITVGLVANGTDTELNAVQTLVLALAGSTVIGVATGVAGGWLLRRSAELGLGRRRWQPVALVALAVATYLGADEIGASGFLAVWVAGLAAGTVLRRGGMDEAFELSEELADVLGAVGFLLLGAGLIVPVIQRAAPEMFIYAILSLTVVRMAPVALVMLRTGFAPASMLYVGWFGPRGLASIVFATVVVEEAVPGASALTDVVLLTVAISMVVHGVTAAWGAGRYASWFEAAAARNPGIPEAAEPADAIGHRRSRGA